MKAINDRKPHPYQPDLPAESLQRLSRYVGQARTSVVSPNFTAREAIALADKVDEIINEARAMARKLEEGGNSETSEVFHKLIQEWV